MASDIVTPAVEAALAKAGPKVAAALGMDVVAGVSDIAAGGEAGLNPLADGAAVVSTPIAAERDAEAIAGAKDVLEALAKSPGGRALLEQSGKTIAEIEREVATKGPAALKEALETPAGRSVLETMKGAWDKLPVEVRGAVAGTVAYVATKIGDFVAEHLEKKADAALDEHLGKPVTISQNGGAERPLNAAGLTGRVVGDDGKDVEFRVGRDTFTLHNLPDDRLKELLSNRNDLQHIAPGHDGRLMISDISQQQQAAPQLSSPSHAGH